MASSCGHSNEFSGFVKGGDFLNSSANIVLTEPMY